MALPGRIDLNDLLVFQAVADAGGFTAAAERLGVATAKVSVEISRLESKIGAALFTRTTRRVVMTDAGHTLYADCRPLLSGLEQAIERAGAASDELSGTLRLSATVDHATLSLAPALAAFARLHPQLNIDLRTSDRVVDLVDEGIDVSIRLGWLRDSSQRAARLGEFEQYVVASPGYLAAAGAPIVPDDLGSHAWIALTLLPTPLTWTFAPASAAPVTIHLKTRVRVDSPGALRALLEMDAGVSALDQFNAQAGIDAGRLIRLLPDWPLARGGIHAVFPPGRQMPARVRGFIAFYRDYLARNAQSKRWP